MLSPNCVYINSLALSVAAVAEWYRWHRIVAGFVAEFEPSTTKDPDGRRAAMHALNLSRAETSSRWWVVVGRGFGTSWAPRRHSDHGSKLHGSIAKSPACS
ncbi:hypothetical protein TNCV_3433501 [Trichonephila clavipes]|nr:hypothetical protein TNCV_3433501 [Trichonephila clavipes]